MAISSTEKRNWRGICIALLVISAVLSIIVFSIFLLSPGMFVWKKKKLLSLSHSCEFLCLRFFYWLKFTFFPFSFLPSSMTSRCSLQKNTHIRSYINDISNRGREDIWEAYSLIRHLQWLAQMEAIQWFMDKWWDFFFFLTDDEEIRL